jgi:transposase
VGATKRGKGTKIMAMADRAGLPLAVCTASASPHEVTLVDATLTARFVKAKPDRIIGDRAYDSDGLDEQLAIDHGIEMIAPHRRNRKHKTQDGRLLRRAKRRWKIERLFAWFSNYRRLVVRWERHADNFLGFLHLACLLILLNRL